jgi:ribonuclease-3
LTRAEPAAIAALERSIGHQFSDPGLLAQAITHSSAGEGRRGSVDNERLEFLGDRVLGLIVAELLMERFPEAKEGELGKRLTALVQRDALATVARDIGLGPHLVLGTLDAATGGIDNSNVLADACEAVIAALYLDGGLDAARQFIATAWRAQVAAVATLPAEPKTALQEWAQGRGKPLPAYRVISALGQAHSPVFEVEVTVEGYEPATASGASKRAAEKAAAQLLLDRIGKGAGA